MKQQEEIAVALTDNTFKGGLFEFHTEVLIDYLNFESAKPLLKEEFVAEVESGEEKWEFKEPNRDNVLKDMKTYMEEYGWPKVEGMRGISAGRTVQKMEVWAWLLEDAPLVEKIKNGSYPQYGAPILNAICLHLGWEVPDSENIRSMIAGCLPEEF